MDNDKITQYQNDIQVDVKEIFRVMWSKRVLIFIITCSFAVFSVLFSLSIPNQYKASAVLAPTQSDGGGLSRALDQLSGLASLAGVSIDGRKSDNSKIAQEIMRSWNFIDEFITQNDLAFEIYATRGWNESSNQLEISEKIYDVENRQWLIENKSTGGLRSPTSWELFKKFSKLLSISEDKKSGLVTLSIEFYSPHTANHWLNLYVLAINKHMQAREVQKVSNNIDYLKAQIAKTSIAEMREVFYTIIEEQTKNKMVAEASPDYAFITISPGMVPEKKSRPNRALICITLTLIGSILGIILSLVIHYAKTPQSNLKD